MVGDSQDVWDKVQRKKMSECDVLALQPAVNLSITLPFSGC